MLDLWRRNKRPLLGIDLSATAVKLLELSSDGQNFQVEGYAVAPLPNGAIIEKNIRDLEQVSEGVRQVLAKAKPSARRAAVAVADSSVITKQIQMDASLNDNDMEEQIIIEADKYIPYPLEEVRLDFDVIGPSAKGEHLVDVLLVASRAENVNTRVSALQMAGIDVQVVDVESYSIERACSLLDGLDDLEAGADRTIAIIDIGATMTNLTVLHNNATVFTREEVFGGQRLTEEIQQRYDLSFQKAGEAKKLGSLPDDYEAEVLDPFKETAVLQARRSLQFFFSTSQHTKIDAVILAGGTAQIPGLASMIEAQLSIPTKIANPFSAMSVSPNIDVRWLSNDAPALMICCGLALRGHLS